MATDKKMGKHCSFLNVFVPVHIRYNRDKPAVKSCDEPACSNRDCSLNRGFVGDRLTGRDFIDQPPRK